MVFLKAAARGGGDGEGRDCLFFISLFFGGGSQCLKPQSQSRGSMAGSVEQLVGGSQSKEACFDCHLAAGPLSNRSCCAVCHTCTAPSLS